MKYSSRTIHRGAFPDEEYLFSPRSTLPLRRGASPHQGLFTEENSPMTRSIFAEEYPASSPRSIPSSRKTIRRGVSPR